MHNFWFLFLISYSLQKVSIKQVLNKISRCLGKDGMGCHEEDGVMGQWWVSLHVYTINIINRHLERTFKQNF